MKFYDMLQLDPGTVKNLMRESADKTEKLKLGAGMVLRAVLLAVFAIVFISVLSFAFGSENTPMAVVIFCILLCVRFVDFGYCIRDELVTLSLVFFLLLISPAAAYSAAPLPGFFINLVSFFMILFLTCDKPEMGNGGLFSFAYIYLSGNPVYGQTFVQRFYLTITGILICGSIFYIKHRNKNKHIRILEKIKQIEPASLKYQWMLRMAIGVSAVLSLSIALHIERFIWVGLACGSLLSEYSQNAGIQNQRIKKKLVQRLTGVLEGAVLFYAVYRLLPDELHGIIGPLGGICLGFCVDYKYKTAMNCLGALMAASPLYGLSSSIFLRIANTMIGILFAVSFYYLYEKYISGKIRAISRISNHN